MNRKLIFLISASLFFVFLTNINGSFAACSSRGGYCADFEGCCAGLKCNLLNQTCYNPSLDLGGGASCYHNSECQTNTCEGSKSPPGTCTGCADFEESCASLSCCSGLRCYLVSEGGDDKCYYDRGESCQNDLDCWSSYKCGNGVCYDPDRQLPAKEPCFHDDECASGSCVSGSCVMECLVLGGVCRESCSGAETNVGKKECPEIQFDHRPIATTCCVTPVSGSVILYDGTDYSGDALGFSSDDSTLVDDGWNDKASSIKVSPGYEVTVYKHINFEGQAATFDSDVSNLGVLSNDISSLKILSLASGGIILYDGIGHDGSAIFINSDDSTLVDDGWNDKASSIKLASGYEATLYEHIDYGGASVVVTSDISDLSTVGFNNKVSSVKIGSVSGGEACADLADCRCDVPYYLSCQDSTYSEHLWEKDGTCSSGKICCCSADGDGDGDGDGLPIGHGIINLQNPLKAESFQELIDNLVNFVFSLAIVIAPLMILIAGYFFVTAAGNTEKIKKAKDLITWTVIGLVVVLLSRAVVSIVKQVFGAS